MQQKNNTMKIGFSAGTRAIDNYDECCELFHFKSVLRGNFAPQKMLYARNATPEGYSVWMLAHTSLNEKFNDNTRWFNFVEPNGTIREVWFDSSDANMSQKDFSYRVCFIKQKSGSYEFQGVYKPEKQVWEEVHGKLELVRTYVRVSDVYPIEKDERNDAHVVLITHPMAKEPAAMTCVTDHCKIKARIVETNTDTTVTVDIAIRPFQESLIGLKIGDHFSLPNVKYTYEIKAIIPVE